MTKKKEVTYDDLIDKVSTYLSDEDVLLIKKACINSTNFNVAYILTDINADAATICAALLRDTDDLSEFGDEISSLVEGVDKIKNLNFDFRNPSTIAMQKKILVGLSDDVRVIMIRLAERIDEMRNLWQHSSEEQKRVSNETLQILIPIAHRLGMNKYKSELEDLSLRYSKPDIYFDIVDKLNQTKQQRDNSVKMMIDDVSKLLNENNIKHQIKGRSKSIYSIYKKLDKGKKFSEIYDLLALRVFVDTEADCYQVLGIIHSKYKPIPGRFKDYIAMPKTNMYQSLHTTVFGIDGYLFEIQIRTYEMDEVAERGIASHWSYKEQGSNKRATQDNMDQKLQFFRNIMELNNSEASDEEILSSVKEEFNSTIYVFTPNGDVIELPAGATPIDFAYKVHSGVGDKMVGAIVNNSIVPLDYELKNQDIVKINTNKNSVGPSREWINMAKTTQAKNKIRSFFKKIDKEENLKKGEEILNKELKSKKITTNNFYEENNISKILKELKMDDLNELYVAIGSNHLNPISVINIYTGENENKEDLLMKKVITTNKQTLKNDIIVEGIDNIKLRLASCCKPIPGDKIIGYITKGYGVSVHRMNCPNLDDLNERLIDVSWEDVEGKKYSTSIIIRAEKKDNLLLEIMTKASNNGINVEKINTYNEEDKVALELTIIVENMDKLTKFINSILQINNVIEVERIIK